MTIVNVRFYEQECANMIAILQLLWIRTSSSCFYGFAIVFRAFTAVSSLFIAS